MSDSISEFLTIFVKILLLISGIAKTGDVVMSTISQESFVLQNHIPRRHQWYKMV